MTSVPRRLAAIALFAVVATSLAFLLLDAWFPFPFERLRRPSAVVVADRNGEPLRMFLPSDERWRLRVDLDETGPWLREAVVVAEDRWFYRHPGVNPLAVLRAAWTNLRAGRVVSGGSTIPMQLARMTERRRRTAGAKLLEAFRALQLVRHLGRDALLEAWLNLAPFGANLEGVGAAAYFYFGKRPADLSLGEAALLAALPRAPNAYDPTVHPDAARRARERVLDQLARGGSASAAEIARARRQALPVHRRPPPFVAPHFAELVAARDPGEWSRRGRVPRRATGPGGIGSAQPPLPAASIGRAPGLSRIVTTLDRRLQTIAERQAEARRRSLRAEGIADVAAVVIAIPGRDVRALVGSGDFFGPAGQVNGAVARRSPGSTLKPFLYARALDEGRVAPESFLLDIPTDFSGYVAENYDGRYRGRVTVREALAESLNASAVRLLSGIGLPPFLDLLRRGGLETLDRPATDYGLPLILGAGEVRLVDLVNLYAALAEGGIHRAWRVSPGPPEDGARLFSAEAAAAVTEILGEVKRPDLPEAWRLTRGIPEVAWKTGTSYGHRDAWAVGFSARYAIGVWVGNFDGRPQKGISGAVHAGPLLFDLFRAIEEGGARIPRPPIRQGSVEVCAASRDLPGTWCPVRTTMAVLPGTTRLGRCRLHRRVFVDAETGERLAGRCIGRRPYRPEVLAVFPAELVAWWRAQGQPVPPLPPPHPACRDDPGGDPPRIVSPAAATPYRFRRDAPPEFQKIALVARAAPTVERLWWYRNGRLVRAVAPGAAVFLDSERGSHRLVVVDDSGRSDAVTFTIE